MRSTIRPLSKLSVEDARPLADSWSRVNMNEPICNVKSTNWAEKPLWALSTVSVPLSAVGRPGPPGGDGPQVQTSLEIWNW
jgi:hypothetical protein